MIYPIRPGAINQEIIDDFGAQLAVGEVSGTDLEEAVDSFGDPVYTECSVRDGALQGMKTFTWGSSVDTTCMRARILLDAGSLPKAEQRKLKRIMIKMANNLKG